ncbi:MAG: thioredoxin domain-containing protein [Candidatus Schekmanbacteria bacterium]|nr:thioredoxin domain-containing protein [Candidatus Schekmanbacteria bacterium]
MNRLANEQSPYLRQHAENPVDWYPWCDEALEHARRENKPILVSIGYSSCHWCHVMERESFENEDIAKVMNENFINIKVDREERPDIDEIYMHAVQMMTGGGGWPLTVFLSPDLKPFFGGTYFPPDERGGLPGFKRVLISVAAHFRNNPEKVADSCEKLFEGLKEMARPSGREGKISQDIFDDAARNLRFSFDGVHGGFGDAPKFPRPMDIQLLIKLSEILSEINDYQFCRDMALFTLRKMAEGGIRDHIAGGFHRYSVDERWFAPHFEKMLYDNALLATVYFEGYRISKDEFFKSIAIEILDFVTDEMTSSHGLFYSALDADSEGVEGKYYLWKRKEISSLLGSENAEVFSDIFSIEQNGNFEEGENIPFMRMDIDGAARKWKIDSQRLRENLIEWKNILAKERRKRVRPSTDDKCITSWNGLMISAFTRAYMLTSSEKYLTPALKAARFFAESFSNNSLIFRIYRNGKGYQKGFLEDYASLALSFITLYRATFDPAWLANAIMLKDKAIELFWDSDEGGFFNTDAGNIDVIVRGKSSYDNAMPSGNSMMFEAMVNLSLLCKRDEDSRKTEETLKAFYPSLNSAPQAYPGFLGGLYDYFFKKKELFAVLKDRGTFQEIISSLSGCCDSQTSLAGIINADSKEAYKAILPSLVDKELPHGKDMAFYFCDEKSCKPPVYSIDELAKII